MRSTADDPDRPSTTAAQGRVLSGAGSTERGAGTADSSNAEDQDGPADVEDIWLIRRAKSGDLQAFEVLVTRHQDRIFRVAMRILGNREDAEDVSQDIVVQLWTGLAAFTGKSRFTTWLHRVVVNRCLTELRRRRPSESIPEASESGHPSTRGAAEQAQDRARLGAATTALAQLPDRLRVVFVLCQLEGLGYRDAAQALGLSEGAVRGRLFRARENLANAMRGWA